jgi:hypothetical protein
MEGQPGSAARKRHREEELGPDVPVEDTVRDMLVKGLSTLPAKALTDLRNALSEQHNVKLDNARQIAEMEERKRQGIAPKGFKIPTFHMPAGTEANEADGKATIMTAYVAVYDDMIAGRRVVIDMSTAKTASTKLDTIEKQVIIAKQMIAGNPQRYTNIDIDDIRQSVKSQVDIVHARAEMETDRAAAKSAVARAEAKEARDTAKAAADAASAADEGSITRGDFLKHMQAVETRYAEALKHLTKGKTFTAPAKSNAKGNNRGSNKKNSSTGVKAKAKGKDRGNDSTSGKGKGSKRQRTHNTCRPVHTQYPPKHKPRKSVRQNIPKKLSKKAQEAVDSYSNSQFRTLNAVESITRSTVVNLTRTQIDPRVSELLGLGPVFRPTPRPAPDSTVYSKLSEASLNLSVPRHSSL